MMFLRKGQLRVFIAPGSMSKRPYDLFNDCFESFVSSVQRSMRIRSDVMAGGLRDNCDVTLFLSKKIYYS